MRTLLVSVLLVGALLVFNTAPVPSLQAQGKAKKDKDKDKKVSKAGVIEIGEGKDGKFRFFVRNGDGKLLAMSGPGGFASKKQRRRSTN
ncbi:MAG: hypothetical protein AB7V46_13510 [Thermomicrobiales bacterium]